MKYPMVAMYILYILSLLKAVTSFSVAQKPGICSNVTNGDPLECCPNYRIVGISCEECWPGSRGEDCKEDCASGFYGRMCRERCFCDPCNKVIGCQNTSSGYTYSITTEQDEGPTRYHWLTILVLSSGGFAICFIVCLTVVCIFRWNSNTRTYSLTKHDTQNDDTLPEVLGHNPLQRLSKVEASSRTSGKAVYPINSCQTKDLFFTTKANRTDDFKDVYGHIDPMDNGCYNILKLKVLDAKDDVYVSKSCSTPQNQNNHMKAEKNVSAAASTASNIINTDERMSKKIIKREKKKHQKDLFRTLNSFKQKDINERKILRYSFVKSTELI